MARKQPKEGFNADERFIRAVLLRGDVEIDRSKFPLCLPALQGFEKLEFHPRITYLVGENGSGKSTLIEAIALLLGLNAEGGSKNFKFSDRRSESSLEDLLTLAKGHVREEDSFFFRAESFFNYATQIDKLASEERGILRSYGGSSLHEQSHGESFMAFAKNRLFGRGIYLLDEPEAALSPNRQLEMLALIHHHISHTRSQFVIATHSPILMAHPDSTIYLLSSTGIETVAYEETEHYQTTKTFLNNREAYLKRLLVDLRADTS